MKMNERLKGGLVVLAVLIAIITLFRIGSLFGSGENVQSESPLVICQPQNAPAECNLRDLDRTVNLLRSLSVNLKDAGVRKDVHVEIHTGHGIRLD